MTPQQRMQAKLAELGIPHDRIECYGAQIMVTCRSRKSAERFAAVLSKFAKVRRVSESIEYCKVNRNTVLRPSTYRVWRTAATV